MKINLTEQSIFNAIKKAFLNEKRAVNDHILEYTIAPGRDKDGEIDSWYLNFYVSPELFERMKSLVAAVKTPRGFQHFVKYPKGDEELSDGKNQIALLLINPEKMIDDEGKIVQNEKDAKGKIICTAGGNATATVGTFYKIYTAANGNEKPSESLRSIIEDIVRTIRHKITGAACSNAVKSAYELWREFCEKLNSNEVQEIIKNLSISYDDDTIIDHRLSVGNKLRALGQAKKYGMDISYLATAKNWRMNLNRQINVNAKPFFLIVPFGETVSKSEVKNFVQSQGKIDPETMSAQQYFEAFIRANGIKTPNGYGWAVYYDVSETTVLPGEKDAYNNDIGYENNLNGTPNEYTRAAMGFKNADTEELSKALYGNDALDTNRALRATQIAANKLNTEVLNPQGDNENAKLFAIKGMIDKMSEYCVVKQGRIKKPENAQPIIKYITAWVMLCMKMNISGLGQIPSLDEKMNMIAYNYFQKIISLIQFGVNETYTEDKQNGAVQGGNGGAVAENGTCPNCKFKINVPSFEEFCNGIR